MEWEFTLDLNTIGGQELSNRLNEKKKIELTFNMGAKITKEFDADFPSFYENGPTQPYGAFNGDIVAFLNKFSIYLGNTSGENGEVIGHANDFYYSDLSALIGNSETVNLALVLKTEKPDTSKIPEINKKIIIIIIIGLSLLIILFIIKFIG